MTEEQNQKRIELRDYFNERGGRNTNRRDNKWVEAFALYQEVTKNKLTLNCGGCYSTCYKWLNQ